VVLAAFEAAAREIGHKGRRRDICRNVRNHRQRLRARGLRPVQFWLPDLRSSDAQEQAKQQSRAVAWSEAGSEDGSLPTPSQSAPELRPAIARGELRVLLDTAPFPPALQLHLERLPREELRHELREELKEDAREQPQIAAILLDNAFSELSTTLVCPLTTRLSRAPLLRVAINPSAGNGLRRNHQLMFDGLTTVPRQQLGACIGRLSDQDLKRVALALLVVLGLAR
jgi:mRNA interferase MazF